MNKQAIQKISRNLRFVEKKKRLKIKNNKIFLLQLYSFIVKKKFYQLNNEISDIYN